jgi:predicted ATPase
MTQDRITSIRIEGLRTLKEVSLRLGWLTVLTGSQGSGKSTIIEACEILRRASGPEFLEEFVRVHGGFDSLLNQESNSLRLGVTIEGKGEALEYRFSIIDIAGLAIEEEELRAGNATILKREGRLGTWLEAESGQQGRNPRIPGAQLLLTGFGLQVPHPAIERTIAALKQIDVQLPFASLPTWATHGSENRGSMRLSASDARGDMLLRLGTNLASVYETLAQEPQGWKRTMEYVRLGLGDDIEDITTTRTERGVELWFKYGSFDKRVPARSLSDGTLDYLAFVAFFRLTRGRSLIAFDEPEGQLHPTLVSRVAEFMETMSKSQSILITTHSDRLLDALRNPSDSVVLCVLDDKRHTQIVRPDRVELEKWLVEYRGLGQIREAGHDQSVMTRVQLD